MEAVTGIGLIIGPLIGSVLYTIGGYNFTFYSFGALFLIFGLIVRVIFPKSIDERYNNDEEGES